MKSKQFTYKVTDTSHSAQLRDSNQVPPDLSASWSRMLGPGYQQVVVTPRHSSHLPCVSQVSRALEKPRTCSFPRRPRSHQGDFQLFYWVSFVLQGASCTQFIN